MRHLLAVAGGGGATGGGASIPTWGVVLFVVAFVLVAIFIATSVHRRRSR